MKRLALFWLAALGVALTACDQKEKTYAGKEDVMALSGLRAFPANTPESLKALTALPPHRFYRMSQGDRTVYFYPDPTNCVCFYVGSPAAYQAYRRNMAARGLAWELTNPQAVTPTELEWGNRGMPFAAWFY